MDGVHFIIVHIWFSYIYYYTSLAHAVMVILQAQIDGKVVQAKFTLPERKKVSPPPKSLATGSRRDVAKNDAEKDGPTRRRDGMIYPLFVFDIRNCIRSNQLWFTFCFGYPVPLNNFLFLQLLWVFVVKKVIT